MLIVYRGNSRTPEPQTIERPPTSQTPPPDTASLFTGSPSVDFLFGGSESQPPSNPAVPPSSIEVKQQTPPSSITATEVAPSAVNPSSGEFLVDYLFIPILMGCPLYRSTTD